MRMHGNGTETGIGTGAGIENGNGNEIGNKNENYTVMINKYKDKEKK
jgi:hypothetical protein